MQDYIEGDYVYDLETYPNIATFGFLKADGTKGKVFEIYSRKNETEGLLSFLRYMIKHGQRLVGFNNLNFDYPIIHEIILRAKKAKRAGRTFTISAQEIYIIAQDQIQSMRGEFAKTIQIGRASCRERV